MKNKIKEIIEMYISESQGDETSKYYYDTSGYPKLIEVNSKNINQFSKNRIVELSPSQYEKSMKVINAYNDLIKAYEEKVEIYKKMPLAIILDKIIKD